MNLDRLQFLVTAIDKPSAGKEGEVYRGYAGELLDILAEHVEIDLSHLRALVVDAHSAHDKDHIQTGRYTQRFLQEEANILYSRRKR